MSGNNQGWYWTPERLEGARLLLNVLAKQDANGYYIGPTGLRHYLAAALNIPQSLSGIALSVFVFLGGLGPGQPGTKRAGYKRRYYPDKIAHITWDDIARFRRSEGVQSSTPPPRGR